MKLNKNIFVVRSGQSSYAFLSTTLSVKPREKVLVAKKEKAILSEMNLDNSLDS